MKCYVMGVIEPAHLHSNRFTPYILGVCQAMGERSPVEVIEPPRSFSYLPEYQLLSQFEAVEEDVILLVPQQKDLMSCWTSSSTGDIPQEVKAKLDLLAETNANIYTLYLEDELQGSHNLFHELGWLADKTTVIKQYSDQLSPCYDELVVDFKTPAMGFMPQSFEPDTSSKTADFCSGDPKQALAQQVDSKLSLDGFEGILNGCYTGRAISTDVLKELRYTKGSLSSVAKVQIDNYLYLAFGQEPEDMLE